MELKDIVPIPTSLDSLSVLSSLLNSGLQTPGLNSLQQPLLVPWSGQSPNSGFPLTMMPVLNQPIISPLTASLSTPKDTLILLPLSAGPSQSVQTPSDLSASTMSCPAFQPMSTASVGHVNAQNSFSNPLAVKSVCSLPILSQPSLPQSHSTELLNGTNMSVAYGERGINSCHDLTGSSVQENTPIHVKNSGVKFADGKERLSWNSQRRPSTPLIKGANATVFHKSNHSVRNISTSPEKEKIGLSVNDEAGISEQQHMACVREVQQSQPDSDSINKVISSLPPGWRVIGLTPLNTYAPAISEKNQASFSSTSLPIVHTQSTHHDSSPPDVVSVDLNVSPSLPIVSSPAAIDSVTANTSNIDKCSVQLCDTPSDRLVSVKTEIPDSGGQVGPTLDGCDGNNQMHDRSNDLKNSSALLTSMKAEPETLILPGTEGKYAHLGNEESQWTVVGVTSLPLTSLRSADPVPLDNLPNLSPLITLPSTATSFSSHQVDRLEKAISTSKTTILNVPLPKISQSIKPIPSGVAANPEVSLQNPLNPDIFNNQTENSKGNASLTNSEWTIVGVTVSPSVAKTQSTTYSNAGMQQLTHTDTLQLSDLNLISMETLKSRLHSDNSNSQHGHTSFSEVIKNLVHGKDKSPGAVDISQPALNNEWKVVGITKLAGEQCALKMTENCQTSNVCPVVSSVNAVPTSTSSISQSIASCPTRTNSSLPYNTFNTLLDSLLKSTSLNRPETSSTMTISESDSQQSNLMQYINGQLLLQHHQQQQQQQLENGNSLPIVPPQILNTNPLNNVNVLNQFQNLLGITTNDDESHNHRESELKNEAAVLNPHINLMSCLEEPKSSEFDLNSSENSKSSLSRLQNKLRKSKFQCIERCIGKPDCVSRKAKDMCVRCMKKHTVSHLLKMKRMKDTDDSGSEDKGDNFECVGQNFKIVKRLSDKILKRLTTRVDRDGRPRPLHSYAGNRKMFSRSMCGSKNYSLERISLRSGTQVPVSNYKSDSNEGAVQTCAALENQVKIENEDLEENCALFKNETRSAARKRKLKVPRKMIADLDYHPFDSSSDSN